MLGLTLWKVPESRNGKIGARLDWLGGLLAALGFGGIVFALIQTELWATVLGALALIALSWWETRSTSPMLPFQLFRAKNFAGANLLTLLLYSALGGVLTFFPMNLIQVQGYSPLKQARRCCRSFC